MRQYFTFGTTALAAIGFLISLPNDPRRTLGARVPLATAVGKLPLHFVKNEGQIAPEVNFYVQGARTNVFFSRGAVTYVLSKAADQPRTRFRNASFLQPTRDESWAVRLEFLDANPQATIEPRKAFEAGMNYFRGTGGASRTGVTSYGAIVYRNIWPGIDVEFAGPAGKLKYTFYVHPYADPKQIRLTYRGATRTVLQADGSLSIETPVGGFSDEAPVAWQMNGQQREPVRAAFALAEPEINFDLANYDPTRELVVDPFVFIYAGYLGGSAADYPGRPAVDATGNLYMTGYTQSLTFPVTVGPGVTNSTGYAATAYLLKLDPSGTSILYSTTFGEGSSGEAVAVDAAGNAYVHGTASSAAFPLTGGLNQTYKGIGDAFVAKVDPTGSRLLYSGLLGGSYSERPRSIAVDAAGSAYIAGYTSSQDFPSVNTSFADPQGNVDVYFAKIDSAGKIVYAGLLGGSKNDWANDLAIDSSGCLYLVGSTGSADFPVKNAIHPTYNSLMYGAIFDDAFVTKIDPSGNALVYSTYLGGAKGGDEAVGVVVDPKGYVYVAGTTDSSDFPVIAAPGLTSAAYRDVFITKINPAGDSIIFSGFVGGPETDSSAHLAVDTVGNVYIAGTTYSQSLPAMVPSGSSVRGEWEAFVARIYASGESVSYTSLIGGSDNDQATSIFVDKAGGLFLTGFTTSTNFSPLVGGPKLTFSGAADVWMARIAPFPATAGPTIAFRDNLGRIQTNTLPSPGLRNAGGVFASDPAAAVGPTGDIYFVARDTAQPTLGSLYFNWLQRDNTYAGWKALAGIVQGTPAIAVTPSHVWMAARDQGGAYWAISYKPSTDTIQSWTYLGGVLATDPVLASCPDGSVYVAGREPFGAIWTRRWDPSASLWQNWVSLRGITKGKPSIACGFDNGAYIAVRDPSDAVWIGRMYQESSGTWSTGNGVFNDDPQILRSGSDLHVFGLSYSVPWYRTWRLAAGWITPWTEIGGVLNQAAPFAYGGNLFVAGLASNGELWWWNGLTTSWTNFGNNGVAPGARLSAARK